jgi:acetyl-CoA acetyltransferase
MREAVVVASSRTPLAKSFRGSFNLTRPDDLAAHCITDVLRKVPQLDPAEHVRRRRPGGGGALRVVLAGEDSR